jgi:uncharacterized membrane protein YdbT with pleckstrin-like domain
MAATNVSVGRFGIDSSGSDQIVLTARPDMRIVKTSLVLPVLILGIGIFTYIVPLPIDADFHTAGWLLVVGVGLVGVLCVLGFYEGFSKAVYRITNTYAEEERGIVFKRMRRIPLSYVRDVTYDQNLLQTMFGVSSVTISPTNGNKIVLSNIRDGKGTQEVIWKVVLSNSPAAKDRT